MSVAYRQPNPYKRPDNLGFAEEDFTYTTDSQDSYRGFNVVKQVHPKYAYFVTFGELTDQNYAK